MARVPVVVLALITLFATAGCLGAPVTSSSPAQTTASTPTATAATTVPPATYPDPPDALTNESATEAVLTHEAARLQNELREQYELTYFELGYVQPVNVTVLNRSDGGLYVAVEGSYAYGTPERSADGVPMRSLYHVNETAIRHVNETT